LQIRRNPRENCALRNCTLTLFSKKKQAERNATANKMKKRAATTRRGR
jgi:hypothetical protein